MIEHVYKNLESPDWEVAVVTDDARIENTVQNFGGKAYRVDDDVISGTLRIQLAYKRYFEDKNFEYIINIQGDEPLIKKSHVTNLLKEHERSDSDIATLFNKREVDSEFHSPHNVKIAMNEDNGRCLYFSRSAIPHSVNSKNHSWNHHVGVYSYKAKALEKFACLEKSKLEMLENLEQLRALENGMSIYAFEVKDKLIGVDTPEDILKVEQML